MLPLNLSSGKLPKGPDVRAGQELKWLGLNGMSALPSRGNIVSLIEHVRKGPILLQKSVERGLEA